MRKRIRNFICTSMIISMAGMCTVYAEDSPYLYEKGEEESNTPFIIARLDDEMVVFPYGCIETWLLLDDSLLSHIDSDTKWDEDAIKDSLAKIQSVYEREPEQISFTSTDGEAFLLNNYGCGWKLDVDASVEEIEHALEEKERYVDLVWRNRSAYSKEDDIGENYIEVDISAQTVYLYRGGIEVFHTACVTGTADGKRDTSVGVFTIAYKTSPATLRGYKPDGSLDYESNVTYWMPFNGGQGFHDATWRNEFGGSIYQWNGSHGCVNLPLWAAERIYENVWSGFPVVVHR